MSEQAVLTPEREDVSSDLQARIREFTGFYEQHAYLAYNVALRITGEPGAAGQTVERAFLRQLDSQPSGLLATLTDSALRESGCRFDLAAAGDPQAQSLMTAFSSLAPVERATLALLDLAGIGADGVGAALGVPAEQAAKLEEAGRAGFATALGLSREQADAAARDWMWAAPPNQIWESLYPQFHQTVERHLHRGATEQTLVLKPASASAPTKTSRGGRRRVRRSARTRPAWLRRLGGRPAVAAATVVLGLGALAGAQMLGGNTEGDDGPSLYRQDAAESATGDDPAPSDAATGESAAKPHKPLTAALLDKLRLRELRQLRKYTRRQADRSLPARQRRAATRRITAIERAARQRLAAQRRREAALRDREARERARSQAPPPPAPTRAAPATPTPRRETPRPATDPAPTGPPASRDDADRSCLLDENSGQYICPQ